jgi:hypothetical protein
MTSPIDNHAVPKGKSGEKPMKEVVPRLGLEPISRLFSSLLIAAFLVDYLYRTIQAYSFVCKLYVALIGNREKKYLCGFVRKPYRCAATVRAVFCAELCGQDFTLPRPVATRQRGT